MRSLAYSLLLLGGSALAQPSEEPLHGNVLVWHDAALYVDASDSANTVHVATLASRAVGHAVPMHVVGTKGDFIEVELVDDGGCTWAKLATNDDVAKLHLFVKRADLAPVLAKPFEQTFADGTKVSLRPGVAVLPADTGYTFSLRGHEVTAAIPAASVAHSYTPEKVKPRAVGAHEYAVGKASLDDHLYGFEGVRATAIEAKGDSALVTFDERCVALTVSAPTKSVKTLDDDPETLGGSSGLGVLDLRDSAYIPALTQLQTPAGHPLAVAAKPIYLMTEPHGKCACVDRRVRLEAVVPSAPEIENADVDDRLRVCAPIAKVAHEKYRHAESANGSASR